MDCGGGRTGGRGDSQRVAEAGFEYDLGALCGLLWVKEIGKIEALAHGKAGEDRY